jgi:hypothetical protein
MGVVFVHLDGVYGESSGKEFLSMICLLVVRAFVATCWICLGQMHGMVL